MKHWLTFLFIVSCSIWVRADYLYTVTGPNNTYLQFKETSAASSGYETKLISSNIDQPNNGPLSITGFRWISNPFGDVNIGKNCTVQGTLPPGSDDLGCFFITWSGSYGFGEGELMPAGALLDFGTYHGVSSLYTIQITEAPEPSTIFLVFSGALGLVNCYRRRS